MSLRNALDEAKKTFPDFNVKAKEESKLMRFSAKLLWLISFGQQKDFPKMITTVGYTIYVPEQWDIWSEVTKEEIVRHECVHMHQKDRYGFWFYIMYLFLPVPILFAYFRRKFEQEAYAESMRFLARTHGIDYISSDAFRVHMVSHFTGPSYLWAWVSKHQVEGWYYNTVALIRIELEHAPTSRSLPV